MTTPYFFGYGSLVNRQTHLYGDAHPAQLTGWRRTWRHIEVLDHAFLVVEPSEGTQIDGLIAAVPGADWVALDERETHYKRIPAQGVAHPLDDISVEVYHSPPWFNAQAEGTHPILLSYLDVVVQGYHTEFGADGVARFFETTDGWDAPVFDDRAAPMYPRHQRLTSEQTALVDAHLSRLEVTIRQS